MGEIPCFVSNLTTNEVIAPSIQCFSEETLYLSRYLVTDYSYSSSMCL